MVLAWCALMQSGPLFSAASLAVAYAFADVTLLDVAAAARIVASTYILVAAVFSVMCAALRRAAPGAAGGDAAAEVRHNPQRRLRHVRQRHTRRSRARQPLAVAHWERRCKRRPRKQQRKRTGAKRRAARRAAHAAAELRARVVFIALHAIIVLYLTAVMCASAWGRLVALAPRCEQMVAAVGHALCTVAAAASTGTRRVARAAVLAAHTWATDTGVVVTIVTVLLGRAAPVQVAPIVRVPTAHRAGQRVRYHARRSGAWHTGTVESMAIVRGHVVYAVLLDNGTRLHATAARLRPPRVRRSAPPATMPQVRTVGVLADCTCTPGWSSMHQGYAIRTVALIQCTPWQARIKCHP